MKVLLISANTETINIPPLPLGLACVAAATRRAGHDVLLLNLMFEGGAASVIRNFRPDVIGVSVRNIDDQNMPDPRFLLAPVKQVIADCRSASGAPIVLGGAGFSIFPESALRYLGAGMGIRGEGELAFPALLERMANGAPFSGLPGLYLREQPAAARTFARLDDLPLPEPRLWVRPVPPGFQLWVPVQSRRGCPMGCTFCSTPAIEGTSIRRHSPEAVAGWLEELAATGLRNFNFVDNTFNLPPSYAKDLCRKIIERRLGLNLWCIVYPKWVDRELVELMARAGCREISLGFESGSDSMLRRMNKRFTAAEVRSVSEMFRDAGVVRRGFLLLGGPGETRESVEKSLAFADSLNLDGLKVTAGVRIYPETPLAAVALAEGVIRPDDDLLEPRFYLAPALAAWLPARVAAYKAARPWAV